MPLNNSSGKRILTASVVLNLFLIVLAVWLHRQIKIAAVFEVKHGEYLFKRDRLYKYLPVKPGDFVFLGDSEILFFDLSELLNMQNVINRGIPGDDTHGVASRLPDALNGHPAKLFVAVGANDFSGNPDSTLFYMNNVIKTTKRLSPGTKLYIHSVLPQNTEYAAMIPLYNAKLRNLCNVNQVIYIDLESKFSKNGILNPLYDGGDGLHLNEKGYLLWAQILKPYL